MFAGAHRLRLRVLVLRRDSVGVPRRIVDELDGDVVAGLQVRVAADIG